MSVYSELLDKAGAKQAKGLKKFLVILILVIIGIAVAAYFFGRRVGVRAGRAEIIRILPMIEICDERDDDCGGANEAFGDRDIIIVPDMSGSMRQPPEMLLPSLRKRPPAPPPAPPAPAVWEI